MLRRTIHLGPRIHRKRTGGPVSPVLTIASRAQNWSQTLDARHSRSLSQVRHLKCRGQPGSKATKWFVDPLSSRIRTPPGPRLHHIRSWGCHLEPIDFEKAATADAVSCLKGESYVQRLWPIEERSGQPNLFAHARALRCIEPSVIPCQSKFAPLQGLRHVSEMPPGGSPSLASPGLPSSPYCYSQTRS